MTGGSSGGGWWESTAAGKGITSVNSYGYRGDSAMYGPKFGAAAEEVFDAALSAALSAEPGDAVVALSQG